jgi:hypothetical protein
MQCLSFPSLRLNIKASFQLVAVVLLLAEPGGAANIEENDINERT